VIDHLAPRARGLAGAGDGPPRWPLILACAVAVVLHAAPARADGQLWLLLSVTKSLATDWRLTMEASPRWESDMSDYSRTALRAQLARNVSGSTALGVGFEFQEPAAAYNRRERRIWQQVQVQHQLGGWALSHRARLEERWLQNADSVVVRTRYQLRASHPVAEDSPWSWQVFQEFLYTLRGSRRGSAQGVDRQRLGGGLSRAISSQLTAEGGYMWQYINRPGAQPGQVDHALVTALSYRF
jgi:Protein of unknown function (DUF2490)